MHYFSCIILDGKLFLLEILLQIPGLLERAPIKNSYNNDVLCMHISSNSEAQPSSAMLFDSTNVKPQWITVEITQMNRYKVNDYLEIKVMVKNGKLVVKNK